MTFVIPIALAFEGTKDRRGITIQYVTAKSNLLDDIVALNGRCVLRHPLVLSLSTHFVCVNQKL